MASVKHQNIYVKLSSVRKINLINAKKVSVFTIKICVILSQMDVRIINHLNAKMALVLLMKIIVIIIIILLAQIRNINYVLMVLSWKKQKNNKKKMDVIKIVLSNVPMVLVLILQQLHVLQFYVLLILLINVPTVIV